MIEYMALPIQINAQFWGGPLLYLNSVIRGTGEWFAWHNIYRYILGSFSEGLRNDGNWKVRSRYYYMVPELQPKACH